ncbi:MAG: glycosyltransferase family 4 protein [Verrucomicrobiota bacterium]
MSGQIHNPDVSDGAPLPDANKLPKALLYSIAADIGGIGLPKTAHEGLILSDRNGFLKQAIAYGSHQSDIPRTKIKSLAAHPVRLLANLRRDLYYGARKHYLDWYTSRAMRKTPDVDCFHGWSGEALRTLIAARQRGIPSLLEVPTWHRNKFKSKDFYTKSERGRGHGWRDKLEITRQQMISEYELATCLLVQSQMSAESFIAEGFPPEKIVNVGRGVDPDQFHPGTTPDKFRLIFVGSLKKRKGVHHLLKAWHGLKLKDAELVLAGNAHDEMKSYLDNFKTDTVKMLGFVGDVRPHLQSATAFVFTSECEGSAKATYEAASCGLPQITTRESGDVVIDGLNGVVIPANDSDALADAIRDFYDHPERLGAMRDAARKRTIEQLTWEHHRRWLAHAYAVALQQS